MISINNNLSALNTAHALSGHYGRLQTSTQRLSSGLRINGAADDAAGLAIRELMRADIAALNQGVRNVNDAISMLQTFDGALGVIDEKLIRMKELAEQAATGTYDSTQRLMIDSEFQAMGAEINRIARATDFNGIKLLCTPMITWYTEEEKFVITNPGSVDNLTATGGITVAVSDTNINAGKYVNEGHTKETIGITLQVTDGSKTATGTLTVLSKTGPRTEYQLAGTDFTVASVDDQGQAQNPVITYNPSLAAQTNPTPPANFNGWFIKDDQGDYIVGLTPGYNDELLGSYRAGSLRSTIYFSMNDENGPVDFNTFQANHDSISEIVVDTNSSKYSITKKIGEINVDNTDYSASYAEKTQIVTVTLKNGGGSISLKLDNPLAFEDIGKVIYFDVNMEGEVKPVQVPHHEPDPDQKLIIHFGTMNDSAEDYYHINYENCTLEGLGLDDVNIKTQDNAQNALVDINEAIVKKDKVRAKFGAMQNRLENTATNLRIQSENLQAAESRISDTEIAMEMMNFVRNQILTNSAVAMLAQANSLPQMVMALIH